MLLESFLSVISVSGGKLIQCNIMQNISFQRCVVDIDKSAGARDTAQIQLQPVGKEGVETACSLSSLIVANGFFS